MSGFQPRQFTAPSLRVEGREWPSEQLRLSVAMTHQMRIGLAPNFLKVLPLMREFTVALGWPQDVVLALPIGVVVARIREVFAAFDLQLARLMPVASDNPEALEEYAELIRAVWPDDPAVRAAADLLAAAWKAADPAVVTEQIAWLGTQFQRIGTSPPADMGRLREELRACILAGRFGANPGEEWKE